MATPKKENYQTKIKLSSEYSAEEREAIAAEIISFIRRRTISGRDVDGSKFPKYSKAYTSSVDFKASGKSKQPNLTLSGDMLASMELVKNKTGEIVVGYDESSDQIGKVEGNQIGSYGQDKGNPDRARRFLGINSEDLKKILAKYPISDELKREKRAEAVLRAQEKIDKFASKIEQQGADELDPDELADKFKLRVGD